MRLPDYELLSKEQDDAVQLPLKGRYLIGGAPGTGKTVVALYRASRLEKERCTHRLMMFSNLLTRYTASAISENEHATVTTYHRWIKSTYKNLFRRTAPYIGRNRNNLDWEQIREDFYQLKPAKTNEYLIIDEGQDLPRILYALTSTFITEHITVFADENQRITNEKCLLKDIISQVRIAPDDRYFLKRNFRNTLQIHNFSASFHRGSPTDIAEEPEREGNRPIILAARDLDQQIEYILNHERLFPSRSIGVLVKTQNELLHLYRVLSAAETVHEVRAYNYDHGLMPEFDQPSITILCYPSAKGLEFDSVFLPGLEHFSQDQVDGDDEMMLLYVMTSRAREDLFLMHSGATCPLRESLDDNLIRKEAMT